jgi:hypothetical protein
VCTGSVPEVPHENFLVHFNAKVGRKDIFKLATRNENLREIDNDNWVGVVNLAMSENRIVKNTILPHRSIHNAL